MHDKMPSSIGINLRVTGHCSQGGRKYMEDFFSVAYQQSEDEKDLEYAFFGIYDGHGGSEAATFAKEHLMNSIVSQKLFWSDCDQDILRAIREGYIATHYAMWREQEKWPKTSTGLPSTAGTTASVAFIRRGKIYIGHVGDSGIVLGYQEEGDKFWRAKALTHDHKPECNVEKARIISSGGKVVTKSGVPRVVWNRPRIGHKGPVRRSTPIDEIPFLAVARSLGDLWSYNSALNEFVVSPDPDVKVVKIDPKSFRCLIFGTDGLWNVLSPNDSVDIAFDAETINERIALVGGSEWTNPSKSLVDKALERWMTRKMRADNTSVVTIMLDPPGPPKREMIRNGPPPSYGLEYSQSGYNGLIPNSSAGSEFVGGLPNPVGIDENSERMYDTHHKDGLYVDTYSTNGYAVMTRCDFECDSNSEVLFSQNSVEDLHQSVANSSYNVHYTNSFAESYNSLLISNYENDESSDHGEREYSFDNIENNMLLGHDHIQNQNQYQQQEYQQQCMAGEDGYSLTKLETRGEQQFNSIRNYNHQQQNVSFQDFGEETFNQYDNITSSYQQLTNDSITRSNHVDVLQKLDEYRTRAPQQTVTLIEESPLARPEYCDEILESASESFVNDSRIPEGCSLLVLDESIQINEVSSSVIEALTASIASGSYIPDTEMETTIEIQIEPRKTRSKNDHHPINIQDTKSTNSSKVAASLEKAREQNENKIICEPRRLRSSILFAVDYNKRTLRSRNSLSKDMKAKSSTSKQLLKRSAIAKQFLKSANTSTSTNHRSRQIQQQQQQQQQLSLWSSGQKKSSTSSATTTSSSTTRVSTAVQCEIGSHTTASGSNSIKQSLVCNRPKTSSVNRSSNSNKLSNKRLLTSATLSSLSITSPSMSKRSSTPRNSAWCPGKTAVQTRNRVQKRLSH